ncbi:hypothetical protein Tco_0817328 [Tanacetum coccineum]
MCVQNGYHGTKLFAFDGSVPILKEFSDVKEYSMRLFAKHEIEKYEKYVNTYLHNLKNSTKESLVSKISSRIITKLLNVAQVLSSIRVHDESGTMSLTFWNDEIQVVVDRTAYQVCDKYGKDLESQTDENTTPINTIKSIATTSGDNDPKKKRHDEDTIGSESSNGK